MENNLSRMIILDDFNYHTWKGKMKDLLYLKDYYLPVFASEKPADKTDEEWALIHRKVCGYIRQWVDDNVFIHVSEEKNAKSIWNKLEELYAPKTVQNKLLLIKQMKGLKYQDGKIMSDHLNTCQGIINQLFDMDIKFDDEVQGLWLLCTLPDSWEAFRTSLFNSIPNVTSNVNVVKRRILDEEMRRKLHSSFSESDILVTERKGRSKTRGSNEKNRSKSRSEKYVNIECYHCGKKGHIKRFCRKFLRETILELP